MKKIYLLCLGPLFVLLPLMGIAQQEKWEGGLFVGASNYMGDFVENSVFTLKATNFAYGLVLQHNASEILGIRLNLLRGQISGDDDNFDYFSQRGYDFTNSLTEASIVLVYEPFGDSRYDGRRFTRILSPYVFAGGGVFFSNPEINFNGGDDPAIPKDIAQDDQETRFTVPVGVGVRYDLSRKWVLGLEIGLRPAFSDLIDGLSFAGNPDADDWYTFGGLTISTRFGSVDSDDDGVADVDDECPTVAGVSSLKGCPDADLDGITDSKDACPQVPGEAVFNGCPDSDGDGVADHQDNCPDDAGERRFRGCPDTDGDQVADPVDLCPTVAGVRDLDGCPDADGDGITDEEDRCPELAGIAAAGGCPDADGDSVIDPDDMCPTRPGPAGTNGCPDTDGDGLHDGLDDCDATPGPVENNGCPVISAADQETLELAMANVRFQTGSAQLLDISNAILDEIAEIMNRYPNYNLEISGYTDNVGNDAANQQLSQRRAAACYNYLVNAGVDRARMSYAGYGETNPLATNDTAEGRARNRRVEFELVPAQ